MSELIIARMKKLLSYAVLALVSTFVLVGCNKTADTGTAPDTNAAPAVTNAAPANP
jgi:hypothetical protein